MLLRKTLLNSLLGAVLVAPLAAGAVESESLTPANPAETWRDLAAQTCTRATGFSCVATVATRRQLSSDVAEYSFTLKVAAGDHDVIGLHRVVKETAPFEPATNLSRGIFLVHGDIWGFDGAFLASAASAAIPDSRALPVYLAENNIDVWGIDQRWTLVDGSAAADLSFMASWGLDVATGDVDTGISVARQLRRATRSSSGPLFLLGWSRGGQVGYAYLGKETLRPATSRQVKAYVPVDIYLKTDVPAQEQAACARLTFEQGQLGAPIPIYADTAGGLLGLLGDGAQTAPTTTFPMSVQGLTGLTNYQAALQAGSALYKVLSPVQPVPFYHLVAGTFDSSDVPTGLRFTEEDFWLDTIKGASPFGPVKLLIDAEEVMCNQASLPINGQLANITVPVLYVGAPGGFGDSGIYTTTLLGSTDVSTLLVSPPQPFEPPARLDFGHSDLFLSASAQSIFWQPLLSWIQAH